MKDTVIPHQIGEDALTQDTPTSQRYGNYQAYLKLQTLGYTDEEAAEHLSITVRALHALVDEFDPVGEE